MAGLVPAIHVLSAATKEDVDARGVQRSASSRFCPGMTRGGSFRSNIFELPEPRLRPSTGIIRGPNFMQSIRPDKPDPIPLRNPPQSMGNIMIRFVGLLVLAVVVLALAWSR
jgi:hypothetical protein